MLEDVDMVEVIDRGFERVRRRRNDIQFDIDVIGWQVQGDPAGLSRAVLNLLDNAAKWSPSGGIVGLHLRQVDSAHAELVVSDQGARNRAGGTRSGLRAVLPFDRLACHARFRAGSGFVKQVVVKHGGMIRIGETNPGDPPGTSFFVLLPGRPSDSTFRNSSAVSEIAHEEAEVNGVRKNTSVLPRVISVDSQ